MKLVDSVKIARRFQRSIRIDADLTNPVALEGFVCPPSCTDVLLQMAGHLAKGHAAFTWTGPYGTGKSSLAVALAAALNGNPQLRQHAAEAIGREVVERFRNSLPDSKSEWTVVPVVGRRMAPAALIGAALRDRGLVRSKSTGWTNEQVLQVVQEIATGKRRSAEGLLLIVDELGKLLEGVALDGEDIHLFQDIAEVASRSRGRFIFVGILHQAFDEYAQNLSTAQRDEWAKIQGRFVDLPINPVGDEQLELLSRAIESSPRVKTPECEAVAELIRPTQRHASLALAKTLRKCWPLHPVTACLLGPLSRRKFGQNQRSLFGFLSSAEPFGFQDFLQSARETDRYTPDRLWDYLRANLEPALLASPDGHRWSTAVEEVDACEARSSKSIHASLLKTIALVDMLKDRSGLSPTLQLLQTVASDGTTPAELDSALNDLLGWSFVIHRRHAGTYAVYAGSDFDINRAVDEEIQSRPTIDFQELERFAGLHPVVAKRHYHLTGALRWFQFGITTVQQVGSLASRPTEGGATGKFYLALPLNDESPGQAAQTCRDVVKKSDGNVVIGIPPAHASTIYLAQEYTALQRVRDERPELAGDAVARREVNARLSDVRARLEVDIRKMVDSAEWYRKWAQPATYSFSDLNTVASSIADKLFDGAPRFSNELLNRQYPSSNAVAAQKELLKRMVESEGKPRLGIVGYPPEGGLFDSLLAQAKLYRETDAGWRFCAPSEGDDPCNVTPLWTATLKVLQVARDSYVRVCDLYEVWRRPPFGVASGLLPFLAVAFLMAEKRHLAFHRSGVFQPRFSDVDVDHLAMDPASIQLRWMDLNQLSENTLKGLAKATSVLGLESASTSDPLGVARQLVGVYVGLPSWTKRTNTLSSSTRKLRDLFKQAADPNRFLFDDLPLLVDVDKRTSEKAQASEIVKQVTSALQELVQAYPLMLDGLRTAMLEELQVPMGHPNAINQLRMRGENIRRMGGDLRLTAFVDRISRFDGSRGAMEDIASLAVSKPSRDWVDSDFDQAKIELADFARRFVRLEAFAEVEGRPSKRDSMAVILGTGQRRPLVKDFTIADAQRPLVEELANTLNAVLTAQAGQSSHVILAALARVTAAYME